MSGLISLQQGPLGVAASSRKPAPRPGADARLRVRDADGSTLDPSLTRQKFEHPPERHESKQYQCFVGSV